MLNFSLADNGQDCKQEFDTLETVTGTGEILEDYSASGRKRPWSGKKVEALELLDLFKVAREIDYDIISDSRMMALSECASWLKFSEEVDGKRKLAMANFCRLRLCPMCAWRRSLKLFSQVSAITDAILAEKKARFIFVTLTVQNVQGEYLRDLIRRMNDGFTYLVAKSRKFEATAELKENLMGYMKAIEITYNSRRNDFHPHIHAIFELKPAYFNKHEGGGYLTHADWREMWQSVMRLDYEPQVNVKAIKTTTARAIAEVAKYPVKMCDLAKIKNKKKAAQALIYLKRGIHNCRMVTFGGDFREYKRRLALDDVENGDLVHVENDAKSLNAVAMVLFRYRADVGAYIC